MYRSKTALKGFRAFGASIQRGYISAKAAGYTACTALLVAMLAHPVFASPATPGAAIAGELSGGSAQMMLIIGAVAVLLGILILWAYVKRTR